MEMNDQLHASAALPTGKNNRYPLVRRLDGTRKAVWTLVTVI
jgi:hypothetical protein